MPVALIGTIAAIYLAGFSDQHPDAAGAGAGHRHGRRRRHRGAGKHRARRNEGMGPRAAAVLGTQEVFFAVIATTATLAAVFVPLSFLPGQTGGLFREFGFVLAISVLLSGVVALTLCPMLASRMLSATRRFITRTAAAWRACSAVRLAFALYEALPARRLNAPCLIVLRWSRCFRRRGVSLFGTIRQELTPREDRSPCSCASTRRRASASTTRRSRCARSRTLIQPLRQSGEILSTFANAGQGGSTNNGFMVLTLAPWDRAHAHAAGDRREINAACAAGARFGVLRACSRTASAFAAPATACNFALSATTTAVL
jgi:HAE1 family hydrophobic/amphiphilic exporter-1